MHRVVSSTPLTCGKCPVAPSSDQLAARDACRPATGATDRDHRVVGRLHHQRARAHQRRERRGGRRGRWRGRSILAARVSARAKLSASSVGELGAVGVAHDQRSRARCDQDR